MNKLESFGVNISGTQDRVALYVEEIKEIIRQIRGGEDIKTCKCSYYPLRERVEMAIKGELGEKYRGLLYFNDEQLIKRLALMDR